jgi:hypothetical protein
MFLSKALDPSTKQLFDPLRQQVFQVPVYLHGCGA